MALTVTADETVRSALGLVTVTAPPSQSSYFIIPSFPDSLPVISLSLSLPLLFRCNVLLSRTLVQARQRFWSPLVSSLSHLLLRPLTSPSPGLLPLLAQNRLSRSFLVVQSNLLIYLAYVISSLTRQSLLLFDFQVTSWSAWPGKIHKCLHTL